MNKESVFTEEEAINITIEHGYDGSEFKTEVWNSRGCLSPNRTFDALISKLETIYNYVEVKGRGKKREYILKDKKDAMTERQYNYKGTVPTEEEELMKEYIFNFLVKTGVKSARPYKEWVRDLGLFNFTFSKKDLIKELKNLHTGILFNPSEIVSEFSNAIISYNKSIVENSFRRLENEGRIKRSVNYLFKNIDGNYEEVNEERYEEAVTFKKELVECFEITYNQYIQAYFSTGHRNNKMQSIINEVDEQMERAFGIDYMFQAIGVSIINGEVNKEVSKEEFEQAYFQKFIKLATNRQNRKDYQETKSFWRRTYLMNTLKILSLIQKGILEVQGLEELLRKEMKRKSGEEFLDYTDEYNDIEFS
ncbi:hypothetical protein H0178_15560 [Cytobacillus firmus]|nr:hypothetical protein [Cytobacillus firmus]